VLARSGRAGGRLQCLPKGGAGMLTSLTETEGSAELPESVTQLEPGLVVNFLPYGEML